MLAHQLLDFFLGGKSWGIRIIPCSLRDFIEKYNNGHLVYILLAYCKKLENDSLLFHEGITGTGAYVGHSYYTNKGLYDHYLSQYGGYDNFVEGFLSIRNRFADVILPIEAKTGEGDITLGSCFVVSSDTIVTAKHCVNDVASFRIVNSDKKFLPLHKVYFSDDEDLDIAVIKLNDNVFEGNKITIPLIITEKGVTVNESAFNKIAEMNNTNDLVTLLSECNILDEVLTLGYPPIADFESLLIADKSQVNAIIKASSGELLARSKKYNHDVEYLILNAKVKGGNSGGPVFDKYGRVIGVIVQMPSDIQNPDLFDSLGYGIALPSKYISKMLFDITAGSKSAIQHSVTLADDWYSLNK